MQLSVSLPKVLTGNSQFDLAALKRYHGDNSKEGEPSLSHLVLGILLIPKIDTIIFFILPLEGIERLLEQ